MEYPFYEIIKLKCTILKNTILSLKKQPRLKIIFISVFTFCLGLAIYFSMYRAFSFVYQFPGFGEFLLDRLLYLFFFSLLLMLIMSSAVTSYMTLFRSKINEHFFVLPIHYRTVWSVRFFDTLVYSSWASLFLVLPLILSYGQIRHASGLFYCMGFLVIIPFLVLAGGVGTLAASLLVRLSQAHRNTLRTILIGTLAIAGIALLCWTRIWRQEPSGHGTELVILNKILSHTAFTQNHFLPSYWLSQGLIDILKGSLKQSMVYFGLICINAALIFQINYHAGGNFYYRIWENASFHKKMKRFRSSFYARLELLFGFVNSHIRQLMIKDIKSFVRDPVQWTQFLIFFGLLGIYIANLKQMPYQIETMFWKVIILFLNLASTAMVLATLTTRFVFPLYSLEGRRFWIIGMMPIKKSWILWEKFFLSFISVTLITEFLIVLSNIMLDSPKDIMLFTCYGVFLISLALTGLSVGMGVLFPNFQDENPSKIVSGFGGTLVLLLSLTYIILMVAFMMMPVYMYYVKDALTHKSYGFWILVVGLMCTLVSIIMGLVPMLLGIKRLEKLEY